MLEELLPYFERELGHLRLLAFEFAERYPKVARRLQLDRDQCEDPHVERLLEAFAFLAARIHRKLDGDFPEVAQAFMQVLYPHFLRPVPSATLLQLLPDTREPGIEGRYRVPRRSPVFAPPVQGVACQFRTCCDTDIWPMKVEQVRLECTRNPDRATAQGSCAALLVLELATLARIPVPSLGLDRIRFFLDGPPQLMALLFEALLFRLQEIHLTEGGDHPVWHACLPPRCVRPVGFDRDEALFETDARTFPGFQLLMEYFAFPDKFMFFDLTGLDTLDWSRCRDRFRLEFPLSAFGNTERHHRLQQTLNPGHFKLGCVPVVNLFEHPGAPIHLDHRLLSYPVVADNLGSDAFEVHAIDSVHWVLESAGTFQEVLPFFSLRQGAGDMPGRFFWHATREASRRRNDRGTDLELSLVDLDFQPIRPEVETLSLRLTCTNRDLPGMIPFGGGGSPEDFSLPSHSVIRHAHPLRKPTPSLRPSSRRGLLWRLVSHLSLNHLSLASQGPQALREALSLYNFTDSPVAGRQIQGLVDLKARPVTARLPGQAWAFMVRGAEVEATLDESHFVGGNPFLFGSVLERFLAYACPPNSFVAFTLHSLQQKGEIARWAPRTGDNPWT